MTTFKLKALTAMVAAGVMMAGAASAEVVGGGATLPENLYNDIFTTQPFPGFNEYIGVGSGAGKRAFFNNDSEELNLSENITVDYVGSDSLVTQAEADNYAANNETTFGKLIQIPSVLTSVTVPYNVPGLSQLNLSSQQLALIFSGVVDNWNHPLLAIPNAPDLKITVVYRPEGSGTTEIFTRHLSHETVDPDSFTTSNEFYKALKKSSVSELPSNFVPSNKEITIVEDGVEKLVSKSGSAGVPFVVDHIPGAIGYVSPDYSDYDNAADVAMINGLLPTEVNVQAAISTVPVPSAIPDEEGNIERTNPTAWGISNAFPEQGYPIVASTNLILSQCYADPSDLLRIRNALTSLYTGQYNGSAATPTSPGTGIIGHSFIPLPSDWSNAIFETFVDPSDPLALGLNIGNVTECAGKGRPS